MMFGPDVLRLDPAKETERLVKMIRQEVGSTMHKRGGVVGISGGIDSSVVLALTFRALGKDRVTALLLPDQDSAADSVPLARKVANYFGIEPIFEDITPALTGLGCYQRRDEAVKRIFPDYDANAGYKSKIVLPDNLLDNKILNVFYLVIITPDGELKRHRLPASEYLQIVAATNFKQRTRMAMLYYHAELRNYAVIGTANKNEHGQGFFVKYGDGGADVRPIVHLYKTQVFQLAEYLQVPEEICRRIPTSDTYSAEQTQEEFFFRLPFDQMDLLWYAQEHDVSPVEAASVMDLPVDVVERIYADLEQRTRTTNYLRMLPIEVNDL